jgi:hypothetical protein
MTHEKRFGRDFIQDYSLVLLIKLIITEWRKKMERGLKSCATPL